MKAFSAYMFFVAGMIFFHTIELAMKGDGAALGAFLLSFMAALIGYFDS